MNKQDAIAAVQESLYDFICWVHLIGKHAIPRDATVEDVNQYHRDVKHCWECQYQADCPDAAMLDVTSDTGDVIININVGLEQVLCWLHLIGKGAIAPGATQEDTDTFYNNNVPRGDCEFCPYHADCAAMVINE